MLANQVKVPKITEDNQYVHSLPPFASDANKALSNEVSSMTRLGSSKPN
jgi:hypothetical protein